MQSFGVVSAALRALAAVTEAVELDVNRVRGAAAGRGAARGLHAMGQGAAMPALAAVLARAALASPSCLAPTRLAASPAPALADSAAGAAPG